MAGRQIFLGSTDRHRNDLSGFISNTVTTARYNLITFLPIQLFEQFKKAANLYFLFIGLLQQIPNISPTGQFTTIGPLALFVFLSMMREAYDDFKRHKQDRKENNRLVEILQDKVWEQKRWRDVKVGDYVRVSEDEPFPADLLLLSSSNTTGTCFVETSSLDGESNLKEKIALRMTQEDMKDADKILSFEGYARAEKPNNFLNSFDGYLSTDDETVPLNNNQLLLRGSSLKNTHWVIGLVIYTGEETKVRLNATKAPTKAPTIESATNILIFSLFVFVIGISIIFAAFSMFWSNLGENFWYLYSIPSNNIIIDFITFLILYNTIIPISLYVTMEIVKIFQSSFIDWDSDMYCDISHEYARANTSTLNEELGQVNYVFTDKTGTLTENVMVFRWCTVAGLSYEHKRVGRTRSVISERAIAVESMGMMENGDVVLQDGQEKPKVHRGFSKVDGGAKLSTMDLVRDIKDGYSNKSKINKEMLLAMALCHTAVPTRESGYLKLQGPSPDEVALVTGASQMEFELMERTPEQVVIKVFGEILKYEVMNVLEFTSNRKRMSVIYRCPDGKIRMYCKGADSVIYPLIRETDQYLEDTKHYVQIFAEEGYRTLVYCKLDLTQTQYDLWHNIYHVASVSIEKRQELLEEAAEIIERSMTILGATAIEDKLQVGVSSTIRSLSESGIKIWMVTGDKMETAVNVGYASSLIERYSEVFMLSIESGINPKSIPSRIKKTLRRAAEWRHKHPVLVVDGGAIAKIFEDRDTVSEFLSLGALMTAVICCRVSPIQKALIVKTVKEGMRKVTLAIGDGANDISMIQEAHVGVGITGKEGMQASRTADYAIGQFRFLRRLLLVHGHWNYIRISKFFLGSFYKCMAFYLTQAVFQVFAGYSGTSLYEQWTLASYNVFFSSLPVIFIGIFEKDLDEYTLLKNPPLYMSGNRSESFNFSIFWRWMIQGLYHSLVMFFVPFLCFGYFEGTGFYQDDGLYLLGGIIYTTVVFVVTLKIGFIESHNWSIANLVVNIGTIGFWFLFQFVYSKLLGLGYPTYGLFDALSRNSIYMLVVLLSVMVALLPDVVFKFVNFAYSPSPHHIFQQLEKKGLSRSANESGSTSRPSVNSERPIATL